METVERHSPRLREYDYALNGAYFVTLCTQGRECVFGEVSDGVLVPNGAGQMVQEIWKGLPEQFPTIELDEWVLMPNHFHGIIVIVGASLVGARKPTQPADPTQNRQIAETVNKAPTRDAPTLGDVLGAFKSITTNHYIQCVKNECWPPFHGKLWQRSYHDRIIRNEDELERIREYILLNPGRWEEDPNHPSNSL
jgi:putative transposase